RWLSLCYHDTSEGTWTVVQDLMAETGFLVEHSDAALFIDTGQKSSNQYTADKVNKRDLVINFRKPRPEELSAPITITGDEDEAESSKEDAAAVKIGELIRRTLKRQPELDGVHYSDLFEEFAYKVKDKPRRPLAEWLLDYFYKTDSGTYRLPSTKEEERSKVE